MKSLRKQYKCLNGLTHAFTISQLTVHMSAKV